MCSYFYALFFFLHFSMLAIINNNMYSIVNRAFVFEYFSSINKLPYLNGSAPMTAVGYTSVNLFS